MSEELKPCPFCGSKELKGCERENRAAGSREYWVACTSCDVTGPIGYTPVGADGRWNRRAETEG